jgi:hypothetical protein
MPFGTRSRSAMTTSHLPAIDYKALVEDDRILAALYTDPRIFEDLLGAGDNGSRRRSRSPALTHL